jgi:NAD(P)-dependent dehydrogenase (short-subunit alcohol dehydrogenase family)
MADTSIFRPGLLDGQVALITGGGTGIGLGIAELLAALGAHTVLASRKREHLDAAVERLRASGGSASAVQLDVREPERVREAVAAVLDERGRIAEERKSTRLTPHHWSRAMMPS